MGQETSLWRAPCMDMVLVQLCRLALGLAPGMCRLARESGRAHIHKFIAHRRHMSYYG